MPPQPSNADAEDVRMALGGDHEAFGRLYDRHAARVRAVVAAVSCDWAAVEDMTQDTFLRGYKRLGTLRQASGFGPWIGGVARRVARERRRTRRRDRHEFNGGVEEAAHSLDDVGSLEQTEETERVLALIADLPERERWAVHSYFFCRQRGEAAAQAIGVSRSGFYVLLNRALDRLRKQSVDAAPTIRSTTDEAI